MVCGITNVIFKKHDDLDFIFKSMLPDDFRIGAKQTTPCPRPRVSLTLGLAPHV